MAELTVPVVEPDRSVWVELGAGHPLLINSKPAIAVQDSQMEQVFCDR
jgi:hypothetical protein